MNLPLHVNVVYVKRSECQSPQQRPSAHRTNPEPALSENSGSAEERRGGERRGEEGRGDERRLDIYCTGQDRRRHNDRNVPKNEWRPCFPWGHRDIERHREI